MNREYYENQIADANRLIMDNNAKSREIAQLVAGQIKHRDDMRAKLADCIIKEAEQETLLKEKANA